MGAAARRKAARDARLQRALDEVTEIDRRWFEQHPRRSTYIRAATPGEIELHHLTLKWPIDPGPGLGYFAVVRQVYPGLRFRQWVVNDTGIGTDVGEECASNVWETLDRIGGSKVAPLEAELKAAMTSKARTVH